MKGKSICRIDRNIIVKYCDEDIILPKREKENIEKFWKAKIEKQPYFFRGDLVTVVDIKENEKEEIEIQCKKTDYAHFLYEKTKNTLNNKCCSVWAGVLLESKDEQYILGRMTKKTATPGRINIPGGSVDAKSDQENGNIRPEITAKRELKEEMGIDLEDENQVDIFNMEYLKIPTNEINSVGFIIKAKLNYTAEEIKKYYEKFRQYQKQIGELIEFDEIIALKKEQKTIEHFFEKDPGPRYKYLEELLKIDEKTIEKQNSDKISKEEEER